MTLWRRSRYLSLAALLSLPVLLQGLVLKQAFPGSRWPPNGSGPTLRGRTGGE